MFQSVFDVFKKDPIIAFLLAIAVSAVLGGMAAGVYMFYRRRRAYTRDLPVMMIVLPPIVAILVGLTNLRTQESNVAAAGGLILTGLFTLTRFRSDPLAIIDLTFVALASAIGMGNGMGYLLYTAIAALAIMIIFTGLAALRFGAIPRRQLALRVYVPEDLDYQRVLDPVLARYCRFSSLEKTRTTDGGQIFELRYTVGLKSGVSQKELIDEIRVLNGNLEIFLGALGE